MITIWDLYEYRTDEYEIYLNVKSNYYIDSKINYSEFLEHTVAPGVGQFIVDVFTVGFTDVRTEMKVYAHGIVCSPGKLPLILLCQTDRAYGFIRLCPDVNLTKVDWVDYIKELIVDVPW